MKKNLTVLIQIVLVATFFSCKSSSDYFIGKWVACNHPETSFTISKKGDSYILHPNGVNGVPDFALEKKAEEVLAIVGDTKLHIPPGAIRFDKSSNHLIITEEVEKEERTIEFCKSE